MGFCRMALRRWASAACSEEVCKNLVPGGLDWLQWHRIATCMKEKGCRLMAVCVRPKALCLTMEVVLYCRTCGLEDERLSTAGGSQ